MKELQEIAVNIFAKRPTTAEDRERLVADFGEREGGYKTIKCAFDDPSLTAVFVECEDQRMSLSVEEAVEALEELYSQLPKKVVNFLDAHLQSGATKPYPRKEGFSKQGQVLSHGIVFTTQVTGARVMITR